MNTPKAEKRTARNIERELSAAKRSLARCTKDFWKASRAIAKGGVMIRLDDLDGKPRATNVQAIAKKAIKLLEPTVDALQKELAALSAPKDELNDF
jgi:hypothetical protein